jgi:hypothetical protein
MTRAERAALRAQRLKETLAAKSQQLAQIESQNRAAERAERARRRQRVGTLADEAGLFAWDDSTLAGLFAALARLAQAPNPVAVLEGLLDPSLTGPLVPGNGYAHPSRDGVSAPR